MARILKFQIKEEMGLYLLYSENKGADQLHGYCAADLCLRRFSHNTAHIIMILKR